jgi:hypothetical protein
VYFAEQGREATMDAGRRIAALTHGDAGEVAGGPVFGVHHRVFIHRRRHDKAR